MTRNGVADLIHAAHDGVVGRGVVLRRHQHAISLCGGNVQHIRFCLICPHAVGFDNTHLMAFNPEVLASEGAHVNDTEKIRLSRFNGNGHILRVVHQRRIWHRFRACRVGIAHE